MISFIIVIIVLLIADIVLNSMNWEAKQELKELETKKKSKKKKYTKEQMKAYEVFCNALNRGVNIDFDGIKCKKVDKNLFLANGRVYELTIENFIKLLKDDN